MENRSNPQSAEFWQGYREGMAEIMRLGIAEFEAKYHDEFGDNRTNDFKGRVKALHECRKRLVVMQEGLKR